MKLGSLFDGSGGFPLAARNVGIEPTWASEIEPFCVAVTRMNFPGMKHLGSVTKIDGAKVEPVDVITFGSPCQDMSVAGKREGLRGERSGLFFEAVRIIKEMRAATNGEYPRYAVWENVLGSLSSNDGRDFGCVLNELLAVVGQDSVVGPNDGWRRNGAICGDAFSLAWRVLDAQYWGVPQRRKRIFLVCDFRSQSAPAVLFKALDVSVLSEQGRESRNGIAPDVERSADETGERRLWFSIQGNSKRPGQHGKGITENGVCYTLNTVERHAVAVFENHGNAGRYRQEKTACQSLTKELGTGGNNAPLVVSLNPSRVDCIANENIMPTIIKDSAYPNLVSYESPENQPRVRFLTSSECAKLQGFPEDWAGVKKIDESEFPFWRNVWNEYAEALGKKPRTDAQVRKWLDNPYRESKEYEMWGNGVALPCVEYIMRNIKDVADE